MAQDRDSEFSDLSRQERAFEQAIIREAQKASYGAMPSGEEVAPKPKNEVEDKVKEVKKLIDIMERANTLSELKEIFLQINLTAKALAHKPAVQYILSMATVAFLNKRDAFNPEPKIQQEPQYTLPETDPQEVPEEEPDTPPAEDNSDTQTYNLPPALLRSADNISIMLEMVETEEGKKVLEYAALMTQNSKLLNSPIIYSFIMTLDMGIRAAHEEVDHRNYQDFMDQQDVF